MPVAGVLLSLWRAVTLLRVVTLLLCLYLIVRWHDIYARPAAAYAVAVAMAVTTAAVGWLAVRGKAHRPLVVGLDVAVTVVLTLASIAAQTSDQRLHGGMPTLTTIWAVGPVLEAAFLLGWLGGMVAGLVQFGAAMVVRAGYDGRTLTSGFLLLLAGAAVGYLVRIATRAEREFADAASARAALAERERLARSVHDGVLQVLALVHRRGRDSADGWADLAASAAEQEAALRMLIASREPMPSGRTDLAAALRALAGDRVTIAVPADPVVLDAHRTGELAAAVRAALDNVARHAGPDARAWVLLEDLGDTVEVTVRDDGCGMAPARLSAAREQGRLGVAQSIEGRVRDLGGSLDLDSAPGAGTTLRLRVPSS